MSTKIQINSKDALERLIGGDTELELELRHAVVTAFTKHHLKGIAETPIIHGIANDLMRSMLDYAKDMFAKSFATFQQTWGHSIRDIALHQGIKDCIRNEIETHRSALIADMVTKAMDPAAIEKIVNARVESRVAYEVREQVEAKMKKIKESLG